MRNKNIGLVKQASAAPNATARYIAYIQKIGLTNIAQMVGKLTSGPMGKGASEPTTEEQKNLTESVFGFVTEKMGSDASEEDVLKVIEILADGISKVAGDRDVNSKEFIDEILESIESGKFFDEMA